MVRHVEDVVVLCRSAALAEEALVAICRWRGERLLLLLLNPQKVVLCARTIVGDTRRCWKPLPEEKSTLRALDREIQLRRFEEISKFTVRK